MQVWTSRTEYQRLSSADLIYFPQSWVTVPKSLLSTEAFMSVFGQWMSHRSELSSVKRFPIFPHISFTMCYCWVFVLLCLYPQLFWKIYLQHPTIRDWPQEVEHRELFKLLISICVYLFYESSKKFFFNR